MARVSAIVFLQISVLLIWSATTDGLPLEDRLEQLTQDFVGTHFTSVSQIFSSHYVKDM